MLFRDPVWGGGYNIILELEGVLQMQLMRMGSGVHGLKVQSLRPRWGGGGGVIASPETPYCCASTIQKDNLGT